MRERKRALFARGRACRFFSFVCAVVRFIFVEEEGAGVGLDRIVAPRRRCFVVVATEGEDVVASASFVFFAFVSLFFLLGGGCSDDNDDDDGKRTNPLFAHRRPVA